MKLFNRHFPAKYWSSIKTGKFYLTEVYLASLNVKWRNRIEEPNVSASISSVPVAKTFPALTSAAHWASASQGAWNIWKIELPIFAQGKHRVWEPSHLDEGDSHELQQFLALLVVFWCHFHQSFRELLHVFLIVSFLGFLQLLLSFFASLLALRELKKEN